MWSLNVDEHHECVEKDHAVFAFDSDASSEVFSQAAHEAFDRVIVVLLVACVTQRENGLVGDFHAFDSEQWM